MKQFNEAAQYILDHGVESEDRTNTGTLSVFGLQMRFNLQDGFPAVTGKKLAWKAVKSELLWFLEGSTDERRLCEILHGSRDPALSTIWTLNANSNYWKPKAKFEGDLGHVYGYNWRFWEDARGVKHDQVANIVDSLKNDPYGRRHILSGWNVGELDNAALPACHSFAQFYVRNGKLSCQMYQRSADFFLGVPFNIASYSLLTHILAQVCDLEVHEFIHVIGDAHIYKNHVDAMKLQLSREPFQLPTLKIHTNNRDINKFTMDDFDLENYSYHASIPAPMAV